MWIDESLGLSYTTRSVGVDDRPRHFMYKGEQPISPWHDLALRPHSELDVFNTIIEITRGTTEKMETETTMQHNPIVQDQKKDKKTGELKLRHYAIEPPFNYGMVPQTWENAQETDRVTGCIGDNDPLDIVDLSSRNMPMFTFPQLKVLGCLCLID